MSLTGSSLYNSLFGKLSRTVVFVPKNHLSFINVSPLDLNIVSIEISSYINQDVLGSPEVLSPVNVRESELVVINDVFK